MLLQPLAKPALGRLRCRFGFLFMPKTIDGERRWLEMALWEEVFYYPWDELSECEIAELGYIKLRWAQCAKEGKKLDFLTQPKWTPLVWINT